MYKYGLQKLYDDLENPKTFLDICNLMITYIPEDMGVLGENIEDKKWEKAQRCTHKLKGTFMMCQLEMKRDISALNDLLKADIIEEKEVCQSYKELKAGIDKLINYLKTVVLKKMIN